MPDDRTCEKCNAPLPKDAPPGLCENCLWEEMPDPVPNHIGPYKLIERIGEGAYGVVYRAEREEPFRQSVALKLIRPGMDSRRVVTQFRKERQALALMDHPNIARAIDGGLTEDRRPFFVMELVKGTPITQFCDDQKLGVHERLVLFQVVCEAVQHAHQKLIIHRDLKPSNILVAFGDDGRTGVP